MSKIAHGPGQRSRRLVSAIATAAVLIGAAACGDDDGAAPAESTEPAGGTEPATDTEQRAAGEAPSTGAPSSDAPATTAGAPGSSQPQGSGGCDEAAATDPADLSLDRPVARCAAGAPEPVPLGQNETYVVSTGFAAEFVAPLFLADAMGEFEKENLDVQIETLPFPDAIPQLVSGQVDVAVGATDSALMNAADQGLGVKWGMGNYFPPDAGNTDVAQTGLWARREIFSDPENPDIGELDGATIASAIGKSNATSYFIQTGLEPAGLTVNDLQWETIESADMVTALENDAVDMAWLLDPYWIEASERPEDYVLIATQTPGEPIGGFYFAPSAFGERREAAEAFTRAIVRTINTYLDGDYQADEEVMATLAEATGQPEESIAATPSLVFDWEIREGTGERIQDLLLTVETLGYTEPQPESEFVDTSLYEAVIDDAS